MIHPPPIRLVVLLEDLELGGTQRYALQLMQRLDRRWFDPEVWVLRGGGALTAPMSAAGVRVVPFSRGRWVGPAALARLAARLWRERPDLLYTLTVIPNIWGRLLGGVMRISVVSGYRSQAPRQHERLLNRFSRRIITNASFLGQRLTTDLGIDPHRVTVVRNGVDAQHFSPDGTERSTEPLVVCVARLVGEKDIPTLLEAFRLTREETPGARLDIIGNGGDALAPAPNVRILPGTDDVLPHLRRAWSFALASRSEASPNALLEAMACGLPVVATRVGGIPELVEDQRSGWLVPPGDPVALSRALTALLSDPARRESMGLAARQRAQSHFDLPRMVRETEAVLREVAQVGTSWTATADGEIPLDLPLWPGAEAPPAPDIIIERGQFKPDRSVRGVGAATLTVFLPPPRRASGLAVVVCPGGAYEGVTIDREGYDVARWLTGMGVAALVLKYRLPPRRGEDHGVPWPLQDVTRALELARSRAAAWHVDPLRIGVLGFSAGGHMAAYASSVDRALAFATLVYPVISMATDLTHRGSRRRLLGARPDPERVARYSMERHVAEHGLPTFLVHARDDDVVSAANSERYAEALVRAGVPHEALFYQRGGHGFGLGEPDSPAAEWPLRWMAWLRERGILASGTRSVSE